jgi:hypothetical protein
MTGGGLTVGAEARLDDLLTEAEAAAKLKLCERTLRKARQAGHLAYIRYGRAIRYAPADLESFIESARQCLSIAEKGPRTGGTRSLSPVVDFEAARAARRSAKPKR